MELHEMEQTTTAAPSAKKSVEKSGKSGESNVGRLNMALYRTPAVPRSVVINRDGTSGRTLIVDRATTYRYWLDILMGRDETDSAGDVPDIQLSAEEKNDMQQLNGRLAGYLEKVRFLTAQNSALEEELEKLKSMWVIEMNAVKAMLEAELDDIRKLYEKSTKKNDKLAVKLTTTREKLEELRQGYDEIELQWQAEKAERERLAKTNAMLRTQVECHKTDHVKGTELIKQLREQLRVIRDDRDEKTIQFSNAETSIHFLKEELKSLKEVHAEEMKYLTDRAVRNTTAENREYWKTEMSLALREIQKMYDDQIEIIRVEYERRMEQIIASRSYAEVACRVEETNILKQRLTSFEEKISRMEAENATLKRQVDALHVEKQDIERYWTARYGQLEGDFNKQHSYVDQSWRIIQRLGEAKVDLKSEIQSYRTMLEKLEEAERWYSKTGGDRHITWERKYDPHGQHNGISTNIVTSGWGPVIIAETSSEGKFIEIENTGPKDEDLSGWLLKTTVDGKDKIPFKLPKHFIVKSKDKRKIWAKGAKPAGAGRDDLEMDRNSWGSGEDVITELVNLQNETCYEHKRTSGSTTRSVPHKLTNGVGSIPMLELGNGQAVEKQEERHDKRSSEDGLVDQSYDQQPQVSTIEFEGKTIFQRSAKGPTAIAETSPEGKFVELENTGRKDEDLSGWRLKTNVDGNENISFKLPMNFILKPGDKIKIWAKGTKPAEAGPRDLELERDSWPSWASGMEIITKLVNPADEDRATHTKKIK